MTTRQFINRLFAAIRHAVWFLILAGLLWIATKVGEFLVP